VATPNYSDSTGYSELIRYSESINFVGLVTS